MQRKPKGHVLDDLSYRNKQCLLYSQIKYCLGRHYIINCHTTYLSSGMSISFSHRAAIMCQSNKEFSYKSKEQKSTIYVKHLHIAITVNREFTMDKPYFFPEIMSIVYSLYTRVMSRRYIAAIAQIASTSVFLCSIVNTLMLASRDQTYLEWYRFQSWCIDFAIWNIQAS